MRKVFVVAVIALLLVLVACGKTQTAKPLKLPSEPASAPAVEAPSVEPMAEEGSGMTAAEAIKDLQIPVPTPSTATGKVATTGLPPAPAGLTGTDALKARTKALYSTGSPVTGAVTADREFGSIAEDLPDEYDNDNSAGD